MADGTNQPRSLDPAVTLRHTSRCFHVLEGVDDERPLFATRGPSTITPEVVARALAAIQAHEFVPADAPIDRYARGDVDALSPTARAELNVFAG